MRGKKTHRLLSILLVVVMLLSVLPVAALADSTDSSTFYRIFHLDCGRKYFSVDQIEALIDTLAENKYTHIELAIGNDGLRFLLDDMSVSANDTTYTSGDVKSGIQAGNTAYYNDSNGNALTQTEMDTIISYANEKGIGVIPLVNTPGHMDAILDCMESVGISSPAYNNSARTVDVTNTAAVNFTLALVNKYIQYFAGKDCEFFNMGCDEYANDVSNSGFAGLISSGEYSNFVTFVNNMAAQVKAAGMKPMAFNDGIYYNGNTSSGTFDNKIVIAYWTSGWPGYSPASAAFLAGKGHTIISTNDAWYYVLGRRAGNSSGYTIATAQNGVQNTACTDIPGDNDPNAAGCMICLWCDTPSASYSTNEVSNVTDLLTTFATNNPTYFVADSGETDPTDPTDPVEVTENKTITVTVGGTATATISGANYAGTYATEDSSIATVEVTGSNGTDATDNYTAEKNVTCHMLISTDSDSWVAAPDYYYTPDGTNYYPVYAMRSSTTKGTYWTYTEYSYTWGYRIGDSEPRQIGNVQTEGSRWEDGRDKTPNIQVYKKTTSAGTPASTTVTFTGVAVGTTYVTVGNTRYTINVVAEDLSKVTPLTVEYWITNLPVTADGATSKAISAQSAYGEAGVELSTLLPKSGTYAYGNVVFWKGTVLDSNNKQTSAGGDGADKTGSGKDFSLLRYYNGSWQYFYEADGTWNNISSTDQVVAYWLQPTEVTKEITTLVKDWGFSPSSQGDNDNKVALTVAVVYPDGTVSPTEADMYSTSTTLFNYWEDRDIGLVAPINNSDYVISKITVTSGTRDQKGTGKWGTNNTITWDKVTNEAGEEWYDETTYWDETVGGTPMVNGAISNITWPNYNTAKLVLIYLKPIHYDTNLIVNWVDDSAAGALISTMEVAVSSDGTPTTFYNGLKQTSALPTEGIGGTFTLDDNAYITNSSNVNQTFNKNISTVPGVADQYKTGLYQYISADLSADGKTLTLHYNIDTTKLSKTYVLDFGLPVSVPLNEIVDNGSSANITVITAATTYGTAQIVGENLVYTPNKVIQGSDVVSVKAFEETIRIAFVPASNVLYEDTFLQGNDGWTQDGSSANKTQSSNQNLCYGYDSAYSDAANYSNGTAWLASGLSDNKLSTSKLSTSFYGNGFDLIGECAPDTAMVYLVIKGADGKAVKGAIVDTRFADDSVNNSHLYQVPLAHLMLEEGAYTAEVSAYYVAAPAASSNTQTASTFSISRASTGSDLSALYEIIDAAYEDDLDLDDIEFLYFDESSPIASMNQSVAMYAAVETPTADITATASVKEAGTRSVIDGFRVYRSSDNSAYLATEQGVEYVNVLEAVTDGFAGYIEGGSDGNYTKGNYESAGGPQNEIYLPANNAVTFQTSLAQGTPVQISARAVSGTASLNGASLSSNTEMYYEVTVGSNGVITVTNRAGATGMLAIANLKLPKGIVLSEPTEATYAVAFSMLRSFSETPVDPEPEPDPVFTPDKLDIKVNRRAIGRNRIITFSITASKDVAKLTVNGNTILPTNALLVKRGYSKYYTFVFMDYARQGQTKSYEIIAYNADGVASEVYTVEG